PAPVETPYRAMHLLCWVSQQLSDKILASYFLWNNQQHPGPRRLGDSSGERSIGMNETDPRVRRTRKLLRDALVELLAEKSFHAINVQEVADRATLNRATFYAHFVDKFAL